MVTRACRSCHLLTTENTCPKCNASSLSTDWVGEIIIVDPDRSLLAKKLNITKPGKYALHVR